MTEVEGGPLMALLRARCFAAGAMTVAEFMAESLGHPEHGYYMTRDPFGRSGDFTTAPEISQMFGELIGLWCAETWRQLGQPEPLRLVELGPGRGTLMNDALRAAAVLPGFLQALRVHMVETSPVLIAAQARTLAGAAAPIQWHQKLDDVPPGPQLLVANELFDALPVRQFQRAESAWHERLVDWDPDAHRFRFVLSQRPVLTEDLPDPMTAPIGAIVERCPAGEALAELIGARVARGGGAALILDYGHGHGQPGFGDTVQAVRGHAYADPLTAPGAADVTAHVDFARLAAAAQSQGVAIYGPMDQGAFLLALGIGVRAERLAGSADPKEAADIRTALARLTAPDQMGTLFKALALMPAGSTPPPGFVAEGPC